jgi:hypothetical protein
LCLNSWSPLGLIHDEDVLKAALLPIVPEVNPDDADDDDFLMPDGWVRSELHVIVFCTACSIGSLHDNCNSFTNETGNPQRVCTRHPYPSDPLVTRTRTKGTDFDGYGYGYALKYPWGTRAVH